MVVGVSEEELGLLGPSEEELHVVLLGETDTTVDLVAQRSYSAASLAYPGLRHRDLTVALQALAHAPGGLVGDEPRPVYVGRHVGAVVLNGLEAPDGPSKLHPVLGVVDGYLQHLLGVADHLGAFADGASAEGLLDYRPALVDVAQDVGPRDTDVIELDLALLVGGDGLEDLVIDSRALGVDDERRYAFVRIIGLLGAGSDDEIVGDMGVGHKELDAA